jgi:uncharacterized protein with GYD domain
MDTQLETMTADFVGLLKANAIEVGQELVDDLNAVREYAAVRMAHLATCVGQPGFSTAVRAERDNVALRACVKAANRGDNIDGRILGFIEGALVIASRALTIVI